MKKQKKTIEDLAMANAQLAYPFPDDKMGESFVYVLRNAHRMAFIIGASQGMELAGWAAKNGWDCVSIFLGGDEMRKNVWVNENEGFEHARLTTYELFQLYIDDTINTPPTT